MVSRKLSSPDLSYQSNALSNTNSSRTLTNNHNNTFSPVIVKSSQQQQQQQQTIIDTFDNNPFAGSIDAKQLKNDYNLGRLDGLVSSPNRCSKVRVADSKKIAAILLETNIIELQRHLLTITVQNQVSAWNTRCNYNLLIYIYMSTECAAFEHSAPLSIPPRSMWNAIKINYLGMAKNEKGKKILLRIV